MTDANKRILAEFDFVDLIGEAISDSMDMDWTASIGARAVMADLEGELIALMNAVRREERERAIAVLRPFAEASAVRLCGDWRDDERIQGTDTAFYVTFGDLRAASSYITQAQGADQ